MVEFCTCDVRMLMATATRPLPAAAHGTRRKIVTGSVRIAAGRRVGDCTGQQPHLWALLFFLFWQTKNRELLEIASFPFGILFL
jgi:hypothetical protein